MRPVRVYFWNSVSKAQALRRLFVSLRLAALFFLLVGNWANSSRAADAPFKLDIEELRYQRRFSCKDYFFGLIFEEGAKKERVLEEDFFKMSIQDFARNFGKPIVYYFQKMLFARGPQTMRGIEQLSPEDERLVKMTLKKSRTPAYLDKEKLRKMEDDEVLRFRTTSPRRFQEKGEDWVRQSYRRYYGTNSVEYGTWKIVLNSGKVIVAPFTSKQNTEIYVADSIKALNGVLQGKHLSLEEISRIDFFHSHPGTQHNALLLSLADELGAVALRKYLDSNGGRHVSLSASSIYQSPRGSIILTTLTP